MAAPARIEAGPESPPIASIDRIRSRTKLLAAPKQPARQSKLKRGADQSPGRGDFNLRRRRLRGRRNDRMRNRHGADVSTPRNWHIRHGLPAARHDASGAYCVSTARSFVLEPPWRKPFRSTVHAGVPPGVIFPKENRAQRKTGAGGKPKPRSDARALCTCENAGFQPFFLP